MWFAKLAALVVSLALLGPACSPSGTSAPTSSNSAVRDDAPSPAAPAPAAKPPSEAPAVVLSPPGHPEARVTVEVARTPRQVQRGLMYRQVMPADHGMLFLMGQERIQSFWMRNTLIPLDMIFIGKDMSVAGVVAEAEPMTDTSRRVDKPSLYVLEVNGGWAAEHHVEAGTPVRFLNLGE
ncbi:DUF192 domain-containing protein [Haliangium sp.]|uniref:DUF192 domain-containing protein n=1 Tax=Haliangium sp. TaxID=2663208 RepID=UPI003D0B3EB3